MRLGCRRTPSYPVQPWSNQVGKCCPTVKVQSWQATFECAASRNIVVRIGECHSCAPPSPGKEITDSSSASIGTVRCCRRPRRPVPGPAAERVEQFRGLLAHRAGAVGAFLALDTDTMGALVNQQSLQTDLALPFGLVAPHLGDAESIALASGLTNADRVWERLPGRRRGPQHLPATGQGGVADQVWR
jgi:hypothetical protein